MAMVTMPSSRVGGRTSGTINSKATRYDWALSILLFSLLCEVIIKINYNAADPVGNDGFYTQAVASNAEGDSSKQFIYLGIFALTMFLAYFIDARRILSSVSVPYALACGYCLSSCAWAIEPGSSIRRSILMVILLYTISTLINCLGSQRTLRVLYWFLAMMVVLSLVVIALHPISLFAFSIHPDNEGDPGVIGCWRGLLSNKNVAGPIASIGMFVFLHVGLSRKRVLDWALLFLSLVFLIGTRSKTALALTFVIMAVGLLYRFFAKRPNGYRVFGLIGLWVLSVAAIVALAEFEALYAFFTNPASLTGRVAIWMTMVNFIKGHVLLGSGYGSFFGIGYKSPQFALAVTPFVRLVNQSHNGYIEILATTGLIGFSLAITAIIIQPTYLYLTGTRRDAELYAVCFTIWLFGLFENLSEAQFFSADRQIWVLAIVAICLVHCEKVKRTDLGRMARSTSVRRRISSFRKVEAETLTLSR